MVTQANAYATGFTISIYKNYKEIKITSPWPDAKNTFTYILYPKGTSKPVITTPAIFIATPIDKIVATSTTDIPVLEYLDVQHKLVGFPHTDYISSEKTRTLIENGTIKELGSEHSINTELVLELAPDMLLGFSADGNTKAYDLIQKTGIPVVFNGSWMESHPLGRAEWIKFIAAFFNKEAEAAIIFENIKKDYIEAKAKAENASTSPTILSGNMFKDIWHVPGGNSYVARFLKDANTNYLWADNEKTGSIALSFESVLEKAQQADLWIGSGNSTSLSALEQQNNRYALFDAFKNKTVYSSTLRMGAKGGLLYYELGPMRPDLIIKDIIKIAHPELLTDYQLYFFEKLD
ncbi:ABC transporter substrate-binding protein [Aquimarina addita]|uniref:ABC transporter substrate-binding protein n=1 Tax=Aquimarina addita TaxID=870485 RepID=A0ABP6UPE5_9FLAO